MRAPSGRSTCGMGISPSRGSFGHGVRQYSSGGTGLAVAKERCRFGIGGEERFDGEFGDGDVERCAEGGDGTEESEFAAIAPDAERDDDIGRAGKLDSGFGLVT